jgi:hypothetical protein
MKWKSHYIKHISNRDLDVWVVIDSVSKRAFSCASSQEAHAIAAALNALEDEECYE